MNKRYHIKRPNEDYIAPEETLLDSTSTHASFENPIGSGVFTMLYAIVGIILLLFAAKAFQLQIIKGDRYARLADKNNFSKYSIISLRGLIYDTNKKPLVENIPILDLVAFTGELPTDTTAKENLLGTISGVLGIPTQELRDTIEKNKNFSSFTLKDDLSKEEAVKLKTFTLQGMYIVANTQRKYIEGSAAAHVLGYSAKVTAEDVKKDPYYLISDVIGKIGIESQYEDILRGEHQSIVLNTNDIGYSNQNLTTGDNVVLNLDKDVQEHLYQAMSNVFRVAGVQRGAAVIQNVRSGAVLGLVSLPSFDPNVFGSSKGKTEVQQLLTDKNQPLFNRALSGRYSPGSTVKPLYALAGLQEHVVTPETIINSKGSISVPSVYDPRILYTFRDWKVHGLTDIKKAIADSVDVYFYALGGGYEGIKGLGIQKILEYLKNFRVDQLTTIDLPGEAVGFLPSPEWKSRVKKESWFIGDTYNISIGQGDLIVTPLWLNSYVSAIANGGSFMQPQVLKEIDNPDGSLKQIIKPQRLAQLHFEPDAIKVVHEGMRQTVTTGTAQILKDLPVQVAAKTGTAQIESGRALNSLFTVYGPYQDPEISVTILVENINKSQGLAMQVAKEFLMWYFGSHSKVASH